MGWQAMTITYEMLKDVGCKFDGMFAYSHDGKVCVAKRFHDGHDDWIRWTNHRGEIPKFRARVKAVMG